MSKSKYPDEFKIEAIKQITQRGHKVADVSERLGVSCRVPDDWLLKTKHPLLHSREVLQTVVATWQSSAKEPLC